MTREVAGALDGGDPEVSAAQHTWRGGLQGKWPSIGILLIAQVAAMAVWFASAAAASTLARSTPLSGFEVALLTSAVQAGFVVGTLVSALLGLPDRHIQAATTVTGTPLSAALPDSSSSWHSSVRSLALDPG